MVKKQNRKKIKRRIIFLWFGSLAIIIATTFTIGKYWVEIYDKYQEKKRLEIRLTKLKEKESILKVDRKFSGSRRAAIHQRRSQVSSENGKIKLRLILDWFSAEIFVNDGEQVMTITLYTDQAADGISFFADGSVKLDVVKYDLIEG